MMPNKPMMPPGGPGGMTPQGPGAPGGAGPAPEQVKAQIVMMLQKMKQMAEANGVNWNEVMKEVAGGNEKASASSTMPPRPPSPGG